MADREKKPLGQYFTPQNIARLMVELVQANKSAEILEPACGEGVFLDVIKAEGFSSCVGLEIDSNLRKSNAFPIVNESFLTWNNKSKFDVVIGNPPYIRWKDLDESAQSELQKHKHWKSLFNSMSDYLVPFIIESVERLKPGGELIFITPSFWMHTLHSNNLRNWLLSKGSITHIIDFGEARVFKGVAISTVVFRFVLDSNEQNINYYRYIGSNKIPDSEMKLMDTKLFAAEEIPNFEIDNHWTLANASIQEQVSKLESMAYVGYRESLFSDDRYVSLGSYVDIANGMVSGLDKAFRIPGDEVQKLNAKELNATLKVVKAKDLSRLTSKNITLYIDLPDGLEEETFRKNYPTFFRLLNAHKQELLQRYSYKRDLAYWDWAFKRSESFFAKSIAKGFVPCKERLTNRDNVRFSLIPPGTVATQDVTAFAPKAGIKESIEYIVAYLTLPEVTSWIRSKGLMKGGVAEFSERPLSVIPFRAINFENYQEKKMHDEISHTLRQSISENELVDDLIIDSIHERIRKILT
jgi:adenine-specific DNA-methyltransferase